MKYRSRTAVVLLIGVIGLALALVSRLSAFGDRPSAPAKGRQPAADSRKPTRLLPGVEPGGAIRLPNQWALRPAGKQVALGDFPVNLALHPSGRWLAALHAGFGTHEVVIVTLQGSQQKVACRVTVDQAFYGVCFAPDGKTLFASGGELEVVHAWSFDDGLLSRHRTIRMADKLKTFVPAGLVTDAGGETLFAAGLWGHAVNIVPLDNPTKRRTVKLEKDSYPYTCLPEPGGKRLFVSLWGKSAIAVLDLESDKVTTVWPTEGHPTEMALAPDGKTLYISCANSTRVCVLDTARDGKPLQTISCALHPGAPSGNTPSSLSLSADGQLLFVANADANNVAVFQVVKRGQAQPLGFLPAGWYPTSVRFDEKAKKIYVANGKGLSSRANPQGPNPNLSVRYRSIEQYIGGLFHGTLSVIDMPAPAKMAEYSKQAYACSPLRADFAPTGDVPEGNPIPAKIGASSPIKHCLYIIKENRTYDQVFGDMKEGNGDPNLCLFGEKVTPNHHKLARQFVLLDNFYVEGEVSADGHQWSMGAYATDFVEKVWPQSYRGRPIGSSIKNLSIYPSEGNFDSIARPAGGYLWDRCAEAKVSYHSYGEWVQDGKKVGDPAKARVKALEGHFDPMFRGWDLNYPDQKRADRFIEELERFERDDGFPSLVILRLPNDHTSGTKAGAPTPRAQVADNDLALGRVVEAVSKSKFWKETAIFVVEDDAQNGPDHVDAHRSVALVVSPYTKRNYVDSTMYSTSSMLRTMELILGLKPMSQFDAAARPMYNAFQGKADATAFQHVVPEVDLQEKNKAAAWGSKLSEKFNLAREDAADDLLLNEVIWRSVKGADSPMPAPVRAAFVMQRARDEDDDD
ncbi:MAG TPA: bifunctional YncE family protein/alkaline phosphatase family protein [Gemmataceae bacterium]|jgi:DNA-binding beta-propeller fold protein YncE